MSRFIVVEGLDGSGKSTLSNAIAAALDAVWLTTPCPEMRAIRPEILAGIRHDPIAVELFYAATVRAASAHVDELITAGRSVVLDRYWLSTIVYARQRAAHLALEEVAATLRPADVTIFLDTPLAVRRARLAGRGMSVADIETLDPERDRRLRQGHLEARARPIVGHLVVLDGTLAADRLLHEALAQIDAHVQTRSGAGDTQTTHA